VGDLGDHPELHHLIEVELGRGAADVADPGQVSAREDGVEVCVCHDDLGG